MSVKKKEEFENEVPYLYGELDRNFTTKRYFIEMRDQFRTMYDRNMTPVRVNVNLRPKQHIMISLPIYGGRLNEKPELNLKKPVI